MAKGKDPYQTLANRFKRQTGLVRKLKQKLNRADAALRAANNAMRSRCERTKKAPLTGGASKGVFRRKA
jgi:hypothetical protein